MDRIGQGCSSPNPPSRQSRPETPASPPIPANGTAAPIPIRSASRGTNNPCLPASWIPWRHIIPPPHTPIRFGPQRHAAPLRFGLRRHVAKSNTGPPFALIPPHPPGQSARYAPPNNALFSRLRPCQKPPLQETRRVPASGQPPGGMPPRQSGNTLPHSQTTPILFHTSLPLSGPANYDAPHPYVTWSDPHGSTDSKSPR